MDKAAAYIRRCSLTATSELPIHHRRRMSRDARHPGAAIESAFAASYSGALVHYQLLVGHRSEQANATAKWRQWGVVTRSSLKPIGITGSKRDEVVG